MLWLCCASAPAPAPPAAAEPALPTTPIEKGSYLNEYLPFRTLEVFSGTAAQEPGLHWVLSGELVNRGNRTLVWIEMEFHVRATGRRFKHVVLDPIQGLDPVAAGATRPFILPVCPLPAGIRGEYDPERQDHPAPEIDGRVVDLRFEDEQ